MEHILVLVRHAVIVHCFDGWWSICWTSVIAELVM